MNLIIIFINIVVVNFAILLSFLLRYGWPFPAKNFIPYQGNFAFLTFIYLFSFVICGCYKKRFRSSWGLLKRIFSAVSLATLLNITFVYVFRLKWGAFPTSVFAISFFINIIILFKSNQMILKLFNRIKRKILIVGNGDINNLIINKSKIEAIRVNNIDNLFRYADIDEIIVCEKQSDKEMRIIAYYAQKIGIDVIFSPQCYTELLPQKINGEQNAHPLTTFVSRKNETEEFAMRTLDIIASIIMSIFFFPFAILISILIKLTSKGPIFYKQKRIGKDGKIFTLYKFRTMITDAEKDIGPVLASENDPRVTKVGRFLRDTRLDEFPQLINVLQGDMSLVGPRPERLFFVKQHKILMEIRLAVKPGLTGFAQIRNEYDLHPKHKVKYDYLYIQRRSLFLNLYIIANTIPVVFLKKGQ